jgi:hypothetical protein
MHGRPARKKKAPESFVSAFQGVEQRYQDTSFVDVI